MAPANPVAMAATRSSMSGDVRPEIWVLPRRSDEPGTTSAKSTPISTTRTAPPKT